MKILDYFADESEARNCNLDQNEVFYNGIVNKGGTLFVTFLRLMRHSMGRIYESMAHPEQLSVNADTLKISGTIEGYIYGSWHPDYDNKLKVVQHK